MARYFTVKTLKEHLERLTEQGFGDRAISFPQIEEDEGYSGTYVLVNRIDTRDAIETAVYLMPFDPATNNELWDEIEEQAYAKDPDFWC